MLRPTRIVHCDWSVHPRKRWSVDARAQAGDGYIIGSPVPLRSSGGDAECWTRAWASKLVEDALSEKSSTWVGFDFPIGIPATAAQSAGIYSLRTLLQQSSHSAAEFFKPTSQLAEVSPGRPFFPSGAARGCGLKARWRNAAGLGLEESHLRACDRISRGESVFWLLGGRQVGRGALMGWQTVMQIFVDAERNPLREKAVGFWPFDDERALSESSLVVFESYPRIATDIVLSRYRNRGRSLQRFSKRNAVHRRAIAPEILRWISELNSVMPHETRALIEAGFGPREDDEDKFDALVGLLLMIAVANKHHPMGPDSFSDAEKRIEGWMIGLERP